jgi:hypothetical protein
MKRFVKFVALLFRRFPYWSELSLIGLLIFTIGESYFFGHIVTSTMLPPNLVETSSVVRPFQDTCLGLTLNCIIGWLMTSGVKLGIKVLDYCIKQWEDAGKL